MGNIICLNQKNKKIIEVARELNLPVAFIQAKVATVLQQKYGNLEQEVNPQEQLLDAITPNDKINIYAGTNENAELSNFANRPFKYKGFDYFSVEQAFQHQKLRTSAPHSGAANYLNDEVNVQILQAKTSAQAKALGKQIKQLNTVAWDRISSSIMKELLLESFKQNPDALQKLLATGNAELTHVQDKSKWGKEFPKLLMEVREELKDNITPNDKVEKEITINKEKWTENSPKQNPNTAYVFTENINSIGKTRKGSGSAVIRNNPNAIGIVTKKYYIYSEDRATSDIKGGWNQDFKDTDEDFELFKKVNLEQFEKIDKFNSVIFPDSFANSLASIPNRFALWLQKELQDRYWLITELNSKGTGLISKSILKKETKTIKELEKEIDYDNYTIDEVRDEINRTTSQEDLDKMRAVESNPMFKLNNTYDAVTKMHRVNLIAQNFSRAIDKGMQENPTLSRREVIDLLGPHNIFNNIRNQYTSLLSNPNINTEGKAKIKDLVDNFDALAKLATTQLSFIEDISIIYSYQGSKDKDSNRDDNPDGSTDNSHDDDSYSAEERVKDGWLLKYAHQSSMFSASQQIKRMLSTLPQYDINGKPMLDDLMQPIYMDYSYAAATLITNLRNMTKSFDLIPTLKNMALNKKWVDGLIKLLEQDKSLQSQFYKVMRKDFINMTVQTSTSVNGRKIYKIVNANRPQGIGYLLETWRDTLEQGVPLNNSPVYNRDGRLNKENIKLGLKKIISLNNEFDKSLPHDTSDTAGKNKAIEKFVEKKVLDLKDLLNSLGIDVQSNVLSFVLTNQKYTDGQLQTIPILIDMLSHVETMFSMLNKADDSKVKDDNGKHVRYPIYQEYSKRYAEIADIISASTDDAIESSVFQGDKMYYSHQVPSYIGKLIKNLKDVHGDKKRFDEFIEQEFKQYNWFFNKGKWKNYWLQLLTDSKTGKDNRELFDYNVMLDFDKVTYDQLTDVQYTISLINNFFIDDKANFANYHIPVLSDSPVAASIKFKRFTDKNTPLKGMVNQEYKDFLLDRFVEIAQQEIVRIKLAKERQKGIKDKSIIKIKNFDDGRGEKFQFLPVLNDKLDEILNLSTGDDFLDGPKLIELLKTTIAADIQSQYEKTYKEWEKIGLFKTVSDTDNRLELLNIPGVNTKEQAGSHLENYFWNSKFATMQIIQLTNTDLAYFKNNIDDFQKRNKQIYAPAERLNTESEYGRQFEKTVTLKDNEIASTVAKEILTALKQNKNLSQLEIAEIASKYGTFNNRAFIFKNVRYGEYINNDDIRQGYYKYDNKTNKKVTINQEEYEQIKNEFISTGKKVEEYYSVSQDGKLISFKTKPINETDAQAYRSLNSYRAVMDMAGKWTPNMQASFEKLQNGTWTMEDYKVVYQPFKPFMYTQVGRNSGLNDENTGQKILMKTPIQNKNSEFLLLPMLGVMQKSDTLKAINDFMEENSVDVVQFESTVKVGLQGAIELNPENTYDKTKEALLKTLDSPQTHYVVPYEDYGLQQEVTEHYIDSTQGIGTQLRKLITADMDDNMIIPLQIGKKKMRLTKGQWLKMYNALNTANILDSFQRINTRFNDITQVEALLQEEIRTNPRYGQDIATACTLVDGKFNINLFEPSQSMRIQTLMNSVIRREITNQKTAGGSLVQATSFGLSQDLRIVFSEDGKAIKYFECYMPWYAKEMLAHLIDKKTGTLDIKLLEKESPELLELIGYRIPTEDKYSMAPLRIKGFLPQESGGVIMLPSEITTISGSDFDVDKMYIMYHKFNTIQKYDIKRAWDDFYDAHPEIKEEINTNYGIVFERYVNTHSEEGYDSLSEGELDNYQEEFKQWLKETNQSQNYKFSAVAQQKFSEWFKGNNKEQYKKGTPKWVKKQIKTDNITVQEDGSIDEENFNKIIDIIKSGKGRQSRDKRDNLIIDMIRSILTHEDSAAKILNPGGFDTHKRAARITTLLQTAGDQIYNIAKQINPKNPDVYEYLNSMPDEQLDALAEKYSETMDITNPWTQIVLQQANTVAGRLISIFANHNAHHAIMQHTQLAVKYKHAFKLNGQTINSLHDIFSFDGKFISRNNAGFLAAAVDAVKDPVLKYLNLNDFTADIAGLLSRGGYSVDSIGLLLTQPIVLEITKEYLNNQKTGLSKNKAIENVIKRYKKEANSTINEYDKNKSFLNKELATNIAVSKQVEALSAADRKSNTDQNIQQYYDNQVHVGYLFSTMLKPANMLADAVAASRADTSNGGTGPTNADTINKLNRTQDYLKDVISEDSPLINGYFLANDIDPYDEGIDVFDTIMNSKLPINQAFYTLGLQATEKIMGLYFPHFKPEFKYIVNKLRGFTTYNKLDEKTMNSVFNDLFAYILTQNNEFGGSTEEIISQADYYINKFPKEYDKLIEQNPELKKNPFIKAITHNNKLGIDTLIFREVGGLSQLQKENVMQGWEALIYSGDKAKKLAIDLFKYAYYRNGFGFGPSSWMHLAPVAVKQAIEGYGKSLDRILSENVDETIYEQFWGQYLINHSNNRKLVPQIEEEDDFKITDDTKELLPHIIINIDENTSQNILKTVIKATDTEIEDPETGQTIKVKSCKWKPVISFEHKGDTVLYAANIDESYGSVTYSKINKAAKENLFLHYIFGQYFRTIDNIIKTTEYQPTPDELKAEANFINEVDVTPDIDDRIDASQEYIASRTYSKEELDREKDKNNTFDPPHNDKKLTNYDGTDVC